MMAGFLSLFVTVLAILVSGGGVSAQDTAGPSSLTETYQDWQVACSGHSKQRRCAFSQQLRQQNGQRILAIELVPAKDGSVSGTMLLPFALELAKGVALGLDDAAAGAPLPFKTCLQAGCVVLVTLPAATVKAYRSGAALKLNMVASDSDKPIGFSLSLNGFGAAFDRTAILLQKQ